MYKWRYSAQKNRVASKWDISKTKKTTLTPAFKVFHGSSSVIRRIFVMQSFSNTLGTSKPWMLRNVASRYEPSKAECGTHYGWPISSAWGGDFAPNSTAHMTFTVFNSDPSCVCQHRIQLSFASVVTTPTHIAATCQSECRHDVRHGLGGGNTPPTVHLLFATVARLRKKDFKNLLNSPFVEILYRLQEQASHRLQLVSRTWLGCQSSNFSSQSLPT